MKKISSIILFCILIFSCSSKKKIVYLGDSDKLAWSKMDVSILENYIELGDILKIDVQSLVPDAALVYNRLPTTKNISAPIDILKLDIEGSEFAVVNSWLKIKLPPVCQILVELHKRLFEEGLELSKELFKTLNALGFTPIDVHFGVNDPDGAVSFFNKRACCKVRGELCSMERHLSYS